MQFINHACSYNAYTKVRVCDDKTHILYLQLSCYDTCQIKSVVTVLITLTTRNMTEQKNHFHNNPTEKTRNEIPLCERHKSGRFSLHWKCRSLQHYWFRSDPRETENMACSLVSINSAIVWSWQSPISNGVLQIICDLLCCQNLPLYPALNKTSSRTDRPINPRVR